MPPADQIWVCCYGLAVLHFNQKGLAMYNVKDVQFELLGRFIELEELGFKPCIFVDDEGVHHEVYSMGSPRDGFTLMEILGMKEENFTRFKSLFIQ